MRRVVVAEHAKHTNETHARRVDGNQDHRLLPVPVGICRVGLAHEDEDLAARIGTAGRPPFAAVDHVVIAVADDRRFDVRRIRRRDVGLGHREPGADLAAQQRLEPALLLRVTAITYEHLHVAGVGRVAVECFGCNPRAAHDLAKRCIFEIGEPGAEIGFGQKQVPQPRGAGLAFQVFHDLRRDPGIAALSIVLDLGREHRLRGINMVVHEAREARGEILHLGRVLEVHVNALRKTGVAPCPTRRRRSIARGFPARTHFGLQRCLAMRARARHGGWPRCGTC